MTTVCPHCGWPDDQPFHVVSRHGTGTGLTAWIRCACGSVQVREIGPGGARILWRGRPDPDAPRERCGA
ncbi:hypothetical protein [Nocardiopsis aegyptia]|uniref:Uncharacterized protein n=1 Tax=Nocardiopsis aegyptia TaxID=220378 RepID=A0A7Z0ETY8_9ACTN|nr:hypothetical protein [Nocardiopsis aegyptia]NYJ38213.1 hypothetical protein [Nocardiopsis aegyptia]